MSGSPISGWTRTRRLIARALPLLLLLAFFVLVASGCDTDTPQNTFDAKGEVAEKQRDLFYVAMWPALVIMIFVLLAIFVIVLRFRERDPAQPPPKQLHGNTRLEVAWTIAPAVLLLGLGIPMVAMIYDLDAEPEDPYIVDVIGQRFSWEFQYPEEGQDENGAVLSSFNEAHVPAGREVLFRLRSVDVIHSFWVPKLGGKRDVMPCNVPDDPEADIDPLADPVCEGGTLNKLWLIAEDPGTFEGQCAEYCGLNHALMYLTVHADSPDDFEAWVDEAQGGGGAPESDAEDSEDGEGDGEATEGT
jgi:cytochrome c oxidase subunit 2